MSHIDNDIDMGHVAFSEIGVVMKLRKVLSFLCFLAILGCDEGSNKTADIEVKPTPEPVANLDILCTSCTGNAFAVREGDTTGVTLLASLATQPSADVAIQIAISDASELKVEPMTATIRATDWKTEKIGFIVTGIEDNIIDGDQTVTLSFSTDSEDEAYKAVTPKTFTVKVVDSQTEIKPDPEPQCTVQCKDDKTLIECDPQTGAAIEKLCEFGCSNQQCQAEIKPDPEPQCTVQCKDDETLIECDPQTGAAVEKLCEFGCSKNACRTTDQPTEIIRFMAANITSGNKQTYDDHKGIRIIQAFKPDIILMQEFNYGDGKRALVDEICGEACHYATSSHDIPNAIISRYPILESGYWQTNVSGARNWDWAVIDIPGDRNLLAVSLHLHSKNNTKEIGPLKTQIEKKQAEGNYYVVVGGDFNTKSRSGVRSTFGKLLTVGKDNPNAADHDGIDKVCDGGQFPVDQNGNSCTSGERDDPYDWVLFDTALNAYEIPITIGDRTYSYGHIVDSRVYNELGELELISPVQASDSDLCIDDPWCANNKGTRTNMQHQAVVRDIALPK